MQRHPRALPRTNAIAAALLAPILASLTAASLQAQPPPGYYDTVDLTSAATLRVTLHEVIDDHTRFPYTSSSTDTWDILEAADEDPANAANILDVYRNRSFIKFGGGQGPYNREHTWPNSYGFPDDGPTNYPYTDCHHLFLCDVGYNSDRANKPFGDCNPAATERVTDFNNGQGGGSGVFPGNSNWFNATLWQTWSGRKGDTARAILYMDVRYEGGTHGITGAAEPDLIVTDNSSLIVTTGGNASVAYMGLLSALLQWHVEDPVDDLERSHTDVVYSYQGNRNPFVDHPEWVSALYVTSSGPVIVAIDDVPADQGGWLALNWERNTLDAPGSLSPVDHYVVQRFEGAWVDVATEPATQAATYSLAVATGDIASPSTPQPWSQYRVAAVETAGWTRVSAADSGYSIDNLAPPQPVVTLDTGSVPWVLSWQDPGIPDLDEACVYRGDQSGFQPGTPLVCTTGTSYLEYDTNTHFYLVQFSDTHGNLSPFSSEVGSTVTAVPAARPGWTGITAVVPNPFNPSTRVSFALSQPGLVRIDVLSADGRVVRTLCNAERRAGEFEVRWDGTDALGAPSASGSYWLRLQSGAVLDARRIVLLK